MKRVICSILAFIFITLNILPSVTVFADDGYTDSQLADIGTIMLSNLITSGEATEIDFSDYTDSNGLDFLIALGELAVTGDTTGLIEFGLDWLGGELSNAYDNFIWSIREWEHDIAPDLYDFWYNGTEFEIDVNKNQGFSKPLRELLTPRGGDEIIPNPDENYRSYINKMNGNQAGGFFWINANERFYYNPYTFQFINFPLNSVSYYKSYYNSFGSYSYSVSDIEVSNILTLYINSIDNSYIGSITNISGSLPSVIITDYNINRDWFSISYSGQDGYINYFNAGVGLSINAGRVLTYQDSSLSNVFSFFADRFRNINIIVDGNPWAIVNYISPTYPIVIPNTLTIFNDQPLQYTFPEPTYLDIPNLKTLITNAINNSTVIKWDDIDDYFVDVNGTPSLPVLQMVRNDYDNMYMEQYPYPATIIGLKDPLKFNEHLLDNSQGYLSPVVEVVENTVDVLPMEIVGVLAIGAILTIFALIINRLLE